MALPLRNGLEMVHLQAFSVDVTTSGADRCYAGIVSPVRGRLVRVKAVPYGTTSGTANAITVKIGTVTVSGASLSFTSGSASAGVLLSATTTNFPIVQQGDVISFNSDGAGTDATVGTMFQASIRRI